MVTKTQLKKQWLDEIKRWEDVIQKIADFKDKYYSTEMKYLRDIEVRIEKYKKLCDIALKDER